VGAPGANLTVDGGTNAWPLSFARRTVHLGVRPGRSRERDGFMTTSLQDDLPGALRQVRTKPLFVMRLDVLPLQVVGATPGAFRRIGVVPGGAFEGERLSGTVLEGGADWQDVRRDNSLTLNVRLALKTVDEALIGMTYRGLRHGPADVFARLDRGEPVDPAGYYFRTACFFETEAEHYAWLNGIVALGVGWRRADGPVYSVFEVL
jgi:hypothetical protein